MQWFRMYSEFATDVKVQSMDETFQRRFTMFLCLQCNGEYAQLSQEELAFALRITPDQLAETQALFKAKGFLGENGEIRNWNKRQYKSDNVTERVKKHRYNKVKRRRNVSVTPSDTDSDTDTDTERTKKKNAPAALVLPAGFAAKEWETWIAHRSQRRMPCDSVTLQKQVNELAKHDVETQREMIDRSINAGWQGIFPPRRSGPVKPVWVPLRSADEIEAEENAREQQRAG